MCLREVRLVGKNDLKRALVDVLHEANVKFALAALAVFVLHPLCQRVVAAERDPPAADAPKEHLHKALGIAVVGLGKFRAAQLRFKHRNKAALALDGDLEGLFRTLEVCALPDAERNEASVQPWLVFQGKFNAKILHGVLLTAATWKRRLRRRSASRRDGTGGSSRGPQA